MKCNKLAESFILQAEECLKSKKYEEALENFNQGLRFSPNKSELLSNAYAGRAQVYFETEQFVKCIENIESSNDANLCEEKCKGFKVMKESCVDKLNEIASENNNSDTCNFFELTQVKHKRIPFIADCLEVRENEVYGRFIMTNKNLSPGDIVVLEEPFYKVADSKQHSVRCAVCLQKNMMNLFPCAKCSNG